MAHHHLCLHMTRYHANQRLVGWCYTGLSVLSTTAEWGFQLNVSLGSEDHKCSFMLVYVKTCARTALLITKASDNCLMNVNQAMPSPLVGSLQKVKFPKCMQIKMKSHRSNFFSAALSIPCDARMSRATQSYATLACCHVSPDWEILSHVLQTSAMFNSHTGWNIADLLRDMVDEWGLVDKDPALVTENVSCTTIGVQLAKLMHQKWFGHSLNSACANMRSRRPLLPIFWEEFTVLWPFFSLFRKITIASHALNEKQKLVNLPKHKLFTDVATRWMICWGVQMVRHYSLTQVWKNAKQSWALAEANLGGAL